MQRWRKTLLPCQKYKQKRYDEILDWLIGVELAKMAADDKLECYWDDEANEMVFKGKPV